MGFRKRQLHDWKIARFIAWVGIAKWGANISMEQLVKLEDDEQEEPMTKEEIIEIMESRRQYLKTLN